MQKSVEMAKRNIDLPISGSRTAWKIRVSGHSLLFLSSPGNIVSITLFALICHCQKEADRQRERAAMPCHALHLGAGSTHHADNGKKGPFPSWPGLYLLCKPRSVCSATLKRGQWAARPQHSITLRSTFCHRKQRSFVIAPLNQSIIHRCSLAGFGYRQRLSRDKHGGISSVEALGNPLKSLISVILDIIQGLECR